MPDDYEGLVTVELSVSTHSQIAMLFFNSRGTNIWFSVEMLAMSGQQTSPHRATALPSDQHASEFYGRELKWKHAQISVKGICPLKNLSDDCFS